MSTERPRIEPRSLLRRLLRRHIPEPRPARPAEQILRSPVRPAQTGSDSVVPVQPLGLFEAHQEQARAISRQITNIEDRLQTETVLERLREKTAQTAQEYNEGKLNRAQFNALYAQYNEKRTIIEAMLARDPDTQAWRRVAQPGHTGFLRGHFEAHVLSFAICEYGKDYTANTPIAEQGDPEIAQSDMAKAMNALNPSHERGIVPKASGREAENGRWLYAIPGKYTTALVLYSLEPSMRQSEFARDLHSDFERANRTILERGSRGADQLVIPHRALFTSP